MSTPHTHMNAAQFTAGCPACIEAAEAARWHEAPLRWVTIDERGGDTWTVQMRVPDGPVDPEEILARADAAWAIAEVTIGDLVHPPVVIEQEGLPI